MTTVRSILRDPFNSMSLIAGCVALSGCVDAAQPTATESAELSADRVTITDRDALSRVAVQTVQYQHTEQGDKFSAPGFTQTAPGEWTMSAHGATMLVKMVPVDGGAHPRVACNLLFYVGPSSPFGFVGEAAIGGIDCLESAVVTTITTQVCTDLVGCTPPHSETGVGSFTSGSGAPGTAGAACSGIVTWNPPGVTASSFNPCG